MTVTLSVLLIIYYIFLFIFAIFFFINLMHIIFTGTTTFAGFAVTFLVICMSAFVIFTTFHILQDVDWNLPLLSINI